VCDYPRITEDAGIMCFKLKCKSMETNLITTEWTELGNCDPFDGHWASTWGTTYDAPLNSFIGEI